MDTATLLLRRQTLQNRLEQRRLLIAETAASTRKNGVLGLALTAGAGLLASFGSYGLLGKWVRSIIWAVAVPALMNALRRGGDNVFSNLTKAITGSISRHSSHS